MDKDEELQKTREFADIMERSSGVRPDDAAAHALRLRLLTLYRVLIRKPPVEDSPSQAETEAR